MRDCWTRERGEYGPYRPVLFKLSDGSEKWKSYKPDAPELTWLRKGESYQAVIVGDEFKLVDPNSAPEPQQQETITGLDADKKRAIAAYVQDLAALYAYCYQQSRQQLEPHEASEETARCAASSLFIAASRKFSL